MRDHGVGEAFAALGSRYEATMGTTGPAAQAALATTATRPTTRGHGTAAVSHRAVRRHEAKSQRGLAGTWSAGSSLR
jgi:hypothetical protein